MIMGGIPFYLSLLRHRENLAQNIDRLYFSKNSELSKEYRRLYASLYKKPEMYMRIVETLAKSRQGMTRNEIAEKLKVQSSGLLTKQLENLCSCDIIRQYVTKVNGKMKQKDAYYIISPAPFLHLTRSIDVKVHRSFERPRLQMHMRVTSSIFHPTSYFLPLSSKFSHQILNK